jgi:hypothetical protein
MFRTVFARCSACGSVFHSPTANRGGSASEAIQREEVEMEGCSSTFRTPQAADIPAAAAAFCFRCGHRTVANLPRPVGLMRYAACNRVWRLRGRRESEATVVPQAADNDTMEDATGDTMLAGDARKERLVVLAAYNVPLRTAVSLERAVLQLRGHWEHSPSSDGD